MCLYPNENYPNVPLRPALSHTIIVQFKPHFYYFAPILGGFKSIVVNKVDRFMDCCLLAAVCVGSDNVIGYGIACLVFLEGVRRVLVQTFIRVCVGVNSVETYFASYFVSLYV